MHPFLIFVTFLPAVSTLLLYGCTLTDNLCDENEYCFPDGVFGQCFSANSGTPPPTVIENLDDAQLELLRLELTRLSNSGQQWPDTRTQCVLAYFKLSVFYGLQYDPEFCQVRNPANIWALIQLIDLGLSEDPSILNENQLLDDTREKYAVEDAEDQQIDQVVPLAPAAVEVPDEDIEDILQQINEPAPELDMDDFLQQQGEVDPVVEKYMEDIIKNENPDLSALSDSQLNELISRLFILKENLSADEGEPVEVNGEPEEAVPLDEETLAEQQSVLKKDAEELGEVNQGLDNTAHKIVKGRNSGIARVVGNRVYLKVNIKQEEQLYPLIEFLENTIALPNNLLFDDFQFDNGQLSMRISRFEGQKPKNEKRINTVEGVAQAVYKRRKDIARFSGAEVAETGIGIGEESVPVESSERDWIFTPVLFVCAFTISALLTVLGVHVYKNRRYSNNNIQALAESLDGKNSQQYQDLCRQHMSNEPVVAGGRGSKSSSTSSWCGEEGAGPAIDISTGHVILNFLQEFLSDPTRIEAQWDSISEYRNTTKHTSIAQKHPEKNRTVLPFDENLVPVEAWKEGEAAYLNASFVYDDDPRQAVYMTAQSPRGDDVAQFWQAVWQHGVCLIVNLSTLEESKQEKSYWPDTGSQIYGPFEIHLVSEHIWSDDYLVRSFYLKNLQSGETRTITQFHYLSWAKDSTPTSPKSLLEFRRKVNKSYRGRSSPVLVHSWDGAGRAGVYCAVDLLCARLLRGVRQLDVAASVEHLRDQRDGMVRTSAQFKLIYGSVAQEVSALLKAAPQ